MTIIKLLANNALELMNFAGMSLAYASATPVSPLALLLRRRAGGQSSQLSAALGGQNKHEKIWP